MFNKEKINELYPEAVMYEPMKIHNSTDAQLKEADASGEWFGQLKKDGAWYMYEHHNDKYDGFNHTYLFGRTESKKTGLLTEKSANVPHIISALNDLPAHTILIGEIYYPGGSSKDTVSIMGCLADKAITRQNGEYGLIHYYIHDILMYDGIDFVKNNVNNELRYKILEKIYYKHKLNEFAYLELAKVWTNNLYDEVAAALSHGEEGMVLKKKTGYYEPDKRPMTNLKAKKVDYIDAFIIGFEPPTKEYYGKDLTNWEYWISNSGDTEYPLPIGLHYGEENITPVTKAYYMGWTNSRIKIGAYDGTQDIDIGTIHSGISDDMKKDMTEHPENYLYQVCAIQCMEKDNKELTLRHGFFKYMRPDKNDTECTIADIFS